MNAVFFSFVVVVAARSRSLSPLTPHRFTFHPTSRSLPSDCCVFGRRARSRASRAQGGCGREEEVELLILSHWPDSTRHSCANGPAVLRTASSSFLCAQDQSRRFMAWGSHAPPPGGLSPRLTKAPIGLCQVLLELGWEPKQVLSRPTLRESLLGRPARLCGAKATAEPCLYLPVIYSTLRGSGQLFWLLRLHRRHCSHNTGPAGTLLAAPQHTAKLLVSVDYWC